LRYHITTGIGIGTRIGIGAGKKYRVSEVSVNPGIGLSLLISYNIALVNFPCICASVTFLLFYVLGQ